MAKDYYQILGIAKGASDRDIKRAYRSLSMQYHPDKNPSPEAQEKFKEINTAYEVLSDSEKRAIYDRYGHDAFVNGAGAGGGFHFEGNFGDFFGGMGMDLNDILSSMFGGGPRQRRPENSSIQTTVNLTFEELTCGKSYQFNIKRKVACECREENPNSSGCRKCKDGFKIVNETVEIPAQYLVLGKPIRFRRLGNQEYANLPAGDLIVNIQALEHKVFKVDEDYNLYYNYPLDALDFILGTTVKVPLLDRVEEVTIPAGTSFYYSKVFVEQGLNIALNSADRRTHLIVNFVAITPNLTEDELAQLREFASKRKNKDLKELKIRYRPLSVIAQNNDLVDAKGQFNVVNKHAKHRESHSKD